MRSISNSSRGPRYGNGSYGILLTILVAVLVSGCLIRAIASRESAAKTALLRRVGTELAAEGIRLIRIVQARQFANARQLETAVEQVRQESQLDIVWIQMRSPGGTVLAHAGAQASPTFSVDFVTSQLQNRQLALKIVETRSGAVLVEAFPILMPAVATHPDLRAVADRKPGARFKEIGVVEIAARVSGTRERDPRRSNRPVADSKTLRAHFTPGLTQNRLKQEIFLGPTKLIDSSTGKAQPGCSAEKFANHLDRKRRNTLTV